MGTAEHQAGAERPHPAEHQATSFAADTLLLTAFVLSLGVPVYYLIGLVASASIVALYVVSTALVSSLAPVVTWWFRWGRPDLSTASMIGAVTFAHVAPGIAVAVFVVAMGYGMALLGVGIMAYIAGVVTLVISRRFGAGGGLRRMDAIRLLSALGTPLIVLSLSGRLPHGADALGGWSIPMLVAVAGALGSARGLKTVLARGRNTAEAETGASVHQSRLDG